MSKKIHAPAVPKVELSLEDAHELRVLSADLERELMRSYEDFLFRAKRQVDGQRWRSVRSQEDMHVFRERESHKHALYPTQPLFLDRDSTVEIGPQAAMAANSTMPMMLATGTITGQLDDAMYGTAFHDTASLRMRNKYQRTQLEDNAVLANVEGPTFDDPFRFLGLVWYYKAYPVPVSSRDFVVLTAIHNSQLSNGERIGVALYHSVQHREAPEFRDHSVLRADISLTFVLRQIDDQRVEVFMMGFFDPRGSTPEMFMVLDASKTFMAVNNICDVAFRRKLLYRVRDAQRHRLRSSSRSAGGAAAGNVADSDNEKHCALCNKSFGGLFSASGSTCQICTKRVCSKCSMTRNIVVESTDAAITTKPFHFCIVCTLDTKEIPSITVARDEQYERSSAKNQQQQRPLMFSHSHSSSSSSSSRSIGSI